MSDLVRVKLDDGARVTLGAGFAASHKLTVIDEPAVDRRGRALPAVSEVDVELRGKELDDALAAAGLPTGGKVAERQARLADHIAASQSSGVQPAGEPNTNNQEG